MNEEIANKIFDILIETCDAHEMQREMFIANQTEGHIKEWRFGAALGFGGKFWRNGGSWYVNCYPEDRTTEIDAMVDMANARLKVLKEEYEEVL